MQANHSYYQAPAGSYFSSSFTLIGWVNLISFEYNPQFFDFSSDLGYDNVAIWLALPTPVFAVGKTGLYTLAFSSLSINLNEWFHIAAVMDGLFVFFYINGTLVSGKSGIIPSPGDKWLVNCFIGRSFLNPTDKDTNALFDDMKLFRRALTLGEILDDMQ